MPTNLVPILAILAMVLSICFNLWWLQRMGQKYPSMKDWVVEIRFVYLLLCLVLFLWGGGLVMRGHAIWQEMVTINLPSILFYLVSLMVALAPIHRRAIQRRRGELLES